MFRIDISKNLTYHLKSDSYILTIIPKGNSKAHSVVAHITGTIALLPYSNVYFTSKLRKDYYLNQGCTNPGRLNDVFSLTFVDLKYENYFLPSIRRTEY